ncbi:hypothetical protein [Legionella longbeachae]|uniref:hypothetical protein n=1 Tax=Legionella longbeachae TaxID=450 RepID=UPI0001BEC167|nr:hypothetical protein [Legionella longbeachae]VEE01684.1 Uncharacterised protein [Legionella oakridgensis]HBD7396442.1 hypothetical protein [Legionella pneumophila]ARB91980.1 hypothetical protein A6J40_07220 [Legionella longbeachae]ARM34835.1 hypothetical protein B0B39_15500 [Legionella longbeachae]EEZ95721.1 putative lipoprotein [Legionella longbeachae D-4968]
MKYLIPSFLVLPLLASCQMKQPEYYDAGYFHSVPPRAEIYGFDERLHDYRHPSHGHRPTPQKKENVDSKNSQT